MNLCMQFHMQVHLDLCSHIHVCEHFFHVRAYSYIKADENQWGTGDCSMWRDRYVFEMLTSPKWLVENHQSLGTGGRGFD